MEKSLSLTLRPDGLKTFFPFFQQGVIIKTPVGCSLKELLLQHLGISPEYAESRIQTIFLDGKAVDNLEKALIRNGSTLALSGALEEAEDEDLILVTGSLFTVGEARSYLVSEGMI